VVTKHSDTSLIDLLKAGADADAAQEVWQRYSARLIGLARQKLRNTSKRVADEEDVALSAMNSFFRGASAGRFSKLDDRDDLWQILAMLAERKAINTIRSQGSAKRGGGTVRGESALIGAPESASGTGPEKFSDPEPGPEVVAAFADECRQLFALLENAELRTVALQKMEGFSCEEIAQSIGRAPRSVERKLRTIRKIWQEHIETSAH
jgi:DNA-directed RNA polymerase specialized sigma24 family protein